MAHSTPSVAAMAGTDEANRRPVPQRRKVQFTLAAECWATEVLFYPTGGSVWRRDFRRRMAAVASENCSFNFILTDAR